MKLAGNTCLSRDLAGQFDVTFAFDRQLTLTSILLIGNKTKLEFGLLSTKSGM